MDFVFTVLVLILIFLLGRCVYLLSLIEKNQKNSTRAQEDQFDRIERLIEGCASQSKEHQEMKASYLYDIKRDTEKIQEHLLYPSLRQDPTRR